MLVRLVFISCMKASAVTGYRAPANAEIYAGGRILAGQYLWPCHRCAMPSGRNPLPFQWGISVRSELPEDLVGSSFLAAARVTLPGEGAV